MSEVIAQAAQAAVQNAVSAPSTPAETPFGVKPEAAPTPEVVAEPTKKEDYAERFAQMARRERKLQEDAKAAIARAKELQAKFDRLKEEPESVLNEYGWNPEKYLERLATGKTPDPTVEDRVGELQAEIQRMKKEREDELSSQKTQREHKAVEDYKKSLSTVVTSDPDRYEAIQETGMHELVWTTAQEVFQQTGKVPDARAVADAVEKDLRSKLEKGFSMKAFADRLKPTGQSATEMIPQQTPSGKTLTASTTAATQPPGKRLTDDERLAMAMSTLKFK